MNKVYLTGTVPVNKVYLTGTVHVNKAYHTGTLFLSYIAKHLKNLKIAVRWLSSRVDYSKRDIDSSCLCDVNGIS